MAVEIARALDDAAPRPCAVGVRLPAWIRYRAAEPYFSEAIGLARQTGDDWRLSQILARQAYGAAMIGEPAPTAAYGAEGVALADAVGDWSSAHLCGWSLSMAMMMRAELRSAANQFALTRAKAEADQDVISLLVCLVSQCDAVQPR